MLKLNNELFPEEAKGKWQTSEIVKAIHRIFKIFNKRIKLSKYQ